MKLHSKLFLGAIFAASAAGCGNSLNCEIMGDNVHGRVNFDGAINVNSDAQVVVELSEDSFSTVKRSRTVLNRQGLLSVPFSLCADSDVPFQVRAFQDDNHNGAWDSGSEGAGRDDGSSGTHEAYSTRTVTSSDLGSSSWDEVKDVNISIDETTGL